MQQFNVCVADDCVDEVTILCEGLKLHNYSAVPAYTGQETLEMCGRGMVDLLLLDIGLPDIDGYEVCRRLKENPNTRDIPIIFVTARGEAENVARGFDLGALDYIPKPYNLPMVMVRVDSAMRTHQRADKLRVRNEYIHDTSYTDQLTGLRNRRYLLERLQEEVEKAHRYKYPVSCVVVDVDDLEAMEREWGTASLDDLLVEVAMAMRHASRNYDIIARYDEALFAAVLPHAPLENAICYARKIQEEVSATAFSDPPTHARLTFGVVSIGDGAQRMATHVLGEAMRGLLQAKSHPAERIVARNLISEPSA